MQLADYLNSQGITLQGKDIREIDFGAKNNICKQVFQNVANRFYQNMKRSPTKVHTDFSNDCIDSLSDTSESLQRDCLPLEDISSHKCSSPSTRVMGWIIVLEALLIIYLYWWNWQLETCLNETIFKQILNGFYGFLLHIF